jgi:DNA transposition AAA+ family ATPase
MMNPTFIVTKEHRRFNEFANAVRKERTIGICHGDAGVGKTLSARRYANWDDLEPYITEWGPRSMNRVTTLVELLIIDEAERLNATALELLRDNHDRTHLPMILIGMPGIDQRFRHYPQLYSRLGFSHRYRALGRDELLFVLDRHWKRLGRTLDPDDFTDAQAIAAVERITRGNFRLLERLFPQITRVLKINQLETITDDVVEAAASILVIGN